MQRAYFCRLPSSSFFLLPCVLFICDKVSADTDLVYIKRGRRLCLSLAESKRGCKSSRLRFSGDPRISSRATSSAWLAAERLSDSQPPNPFSAFAVTLSRLKKRRVCCRRRACFHATCYFNTSRNPPKTWLWFVPNVPGWSTTCLIFCTLETAGWKVTQCGWNR